MNLLNFKLYFTIIFFIYSFNFSVKIPLKRRYLNRNITIHHTLNKNYSKVEKNNNKKKEKIYFVIK